MENIELSLLVDNSIFERCQHVTIVVRYLAVQLDSNPINFPCFRIRRTLHLSDDGDAEIWRGRHWLRSQCNRVQREFEKIVPVATRHPVIRLPLAFGTYRIATAWIAASNDERLAWHR